VTSGSHVVGARPKGLLVHGFPQLRELVPQPPGGGALDGVDEFGGGVFWRGRYEEVYVVGLHLNGDDVEAHLPRDVIDDHPQPLGDLTPQNLSSVLWTPDEVLVQRVVGVSGLPHHALGVHTPILAFTPFIPTPEGVGASGVISLKGFIRLHLNGNNE